MKISTLVFIFLTFGVTSYCQTTRDTINRRILYLEKQVTTIDLRLTQTRSSLKKAANTYFLGLGLTIGGAAMIGGGALYASSPKALGDARGVYVFGSFVGAAGIVALITAWGDIHEAGTGPRNKEETLITQ